MIDILARLQMWLVVDVGQDINCLGAGDLKETIRQAKKEIEQLRAVAGAARASDEGFRAVKDGLALRSEGDND